MRHFILTILCFGVLGFSSSAMAQYGKALEQNVTTKAAPIKKPKAVLPAPKSFAPTAAPAVTFAMDKDAKIEVYYDDFSIKKTFGGQVFCQMTFYIENNTKMNLDSLVFDLKWAGISTNLNVDNVAPSDLAIKRYALAGQGCYTMGETPSLKVSKCLMRSFTPSGKVIDVPPDQCKSIVSFR